LENFPDDIADLEAKNRLNMKESRLAKMQSTIQVLPRDESLANIFKKTQPPASPALEDPPKER